MGARPDAVLQVIGWQAQSENQKFSAHGALVMCPYGEKT
jgi:hypothetical protein